MAGLPAAWLIAHTDAPDALVWAPAAGSLLLVVSAVAAWRTATVNAKAFRQSVLPELDVTFITPVPRGYLQVIVRNVGSGFAKMPQLILVAGSAALQFYLRDGVLKPGEGFKVTTDIDVSNLDSDARCAIATCRDVNNVHHAWSTHWEHREFRNFLRVPVKQIDWEEQFAKFYPGVDLATKPGHIRYDVEKLPA